MQIVPVDMILKFFGLSGAKLMPVKNKLTLQWQQAFVESIIIIIMQNLHSVVN